MAIPLTGLRFGDPLAVLREQPDSPRVEFMANGVVMITRRWLVDSGSDLALAPRPKDIDALGYNARCVSTVIQHGKGNQSEVVSTYQGYVTLPPTIYEFANSRFDRPIQMHPNFADLDKNYKITQEVALDPSTPSITTPVFLKFKDATTSMPPSSDPFIKFAGVESFITGSSQWRKTSYALQPDLSQTDVGKLSAPETGPYNGLPDQSNALFSWLKVEKTSVNQLQGASILWVITEVWQFNLNRWLTEFYGP